VPEAAQLRENKPHPVGTFPVCNSASTAEKTGLGSDEALQVKSVGGG
jgi:hypothetical protein